MNTLYLESSAILSWLFDESKAQITISAINSAKQVATSALSLLESFRAITRAKHAGIINEATAQRLRGLLESASMEWYVLEITKEIRLRAAASFPIEPIRSLDAIHLASALELIKIFPRLQVLSFDQRINNNLIPLGLNSFDLQSLKATIE